jgi:hypothetical protein
VNADETLALPELEEHDSVPGLLFHFMEKHTLHEQPLFAGESVELISAFHVLVS